MVMVVLVVMMVIAMVLVVRTVIGATPRDICRDTARWAMVHNWFTWSLIMILCRRSPPSHRSHRQNPRHASNSQ